MCRIQIEHAQIKFPLFSFWTVHLAQKIFETVLSSFFHVCGPPKPLIWYLNTFQIGLQRYILIIQFLINSPHPL
jgi:hypothetical protein